MGIKQLANRGEAFPEMGRIRKGAAKESDFKPGKDLTYFRAVFGPGEEKAAARFKEVYGEKPTAIRFVFPLNDIERQANSFLEAYSKGRMIARSDGEVYLSKFSQRGEMLANNGVWVAGPNKGQPALYDPEKPEYTYTTRNGEQQHVYCKAITRIKIVLPELMELKYMLVLSSSVYDAMNLSEQLSALWELTGHRIAGVPMILRRKPRMVSCPSPDGTRGLREKWLLSIEADSTWVTAQLKGMEQHALLLAGGHQDALPEPTMTKDPEPDVDFEDEIQDGAYSETGAGEAPEQPEIDAEFNKLWGDWAILVRRAKELGIKVGTFDTESPTFEQVNAAFKTLSGRVKAAEEREAKKAAEEKETAMLEDDASDEPPVKGKDKRPWTPAQLRAYLQDQAKQYGNDKLPPAEESRLAACLNRILGGDAARYEFLSGLVGKPVKSGKEVPANLMAALAAYVSAKFDSLKGVFYPIDNLVEGEITNAHAEWLRQAGQMSLL